MVVSIKGNRQLSNTFILSHLQTCLLTYELEGPQSRRGSILPSGLNPLVLQVYFKDADKAFSTGKVVASGKGHGFGIGFKK